MRYAEAKQWIVGRKCWYLLEDFNQGLSFNSAGSLVCPGVYLVRFISFRPVWVESTSLPSPWCRSIVLRCCPSVCFQAFFPSSFRTLLTDVHQQNALVETALCLPTSLSVSDLHPASHTPLHCLKAPVCVFLP